MFLNVRQKVLFTYLTTPRRALQPKGTQWFPRIGLFVVQAISLGPCRRPIEFLTSSIQKTCLYVHDKLQRNPSVGSCLKFFIFLPYGIDYLGFLTSARRGAMGSKTQWVFYRDLDWWPGPQKVQYGEITGYP